MMTLEQLLAKTPDGELMDVFHEIDTCVVPATGAAHSFCRKVNKLIDDGSLCINPSSYRKVYLPALAKALHVEMARRYMCIMLRGVHK
jgi:hypothetical protein